MSHAGGRGAPADFTRGAALVLSSFGWLGRRGLRLWVAVPLAINVVLFALATVWLLAQAGELARWLEGSLPSWLGWLTWLLWPLLALSAGLIWFYGFTLVANFVAAPFNDVLAERVIRLSGAEAPGQARRGWIGALLAALSGELGKLAYVLSRAVPLALLVLVPVVNVLAPAVWFAFGAWLLALEYLDFPLGHRGLTLREQREILAGRRSLVLGFGSAVTLLTLLPLINLLIVPVAVIAASRLAAHELVPRVPTPGPR